MNTKNAINDSVVVKGKLDFSQWREATKMARQAASENRSCVLDMENVQQVFDSGLAVMIAMAKEMANAGQALELTNVSPDVRAKIMASFHCESLVVH